MAFLCACPQWSSYQMFCPNASMPKFHLPFRYQSRFFYEVFIIIPQQDIRFHLSKLPQHEWHLCSGDLVLIINVVSYSFLSENMPSWSRTYLPQSLLCAIITNTRICRKHVLKIYIRWALIRITIGREITS